MDGAVDDHEGSAYLHGQGGANPFRPQAVQVSLRASVLQLRALSIKHFRRDFPWPSRHMTPCPTCQLAITSREWLLRPRGISSTARRMTRHQTSSTRSHHRWPAAGPRGITSRCFRTRPVAVKDFERHWGIPQQHKISVIAAKLLLVLKW